MSDTGVVGSEDKPLNLTQVNRGISGRVSAIPRMWVTAEIMQKPRQSGNSVYLSLTDPDARGGRAAELTARVDAAIFNRLPIKPEQGSRITAFAELSYWPSGGRIAATLTRIQLAGEGAMLERIELLRQSLRREGLFDPNRKKRLPALPRCIGLITGSSTHAESDVLTRTRERWSEASCEIRHAIMRGPDCVTEVVRALRELDADERVDVILIARGGGSIADLSPFSDEMLVRAVAEATTPVVSAIGHEPDHPILDDVADVRVGTPTHAAAALVPDVTGDRRLIDQLLERAQAGLIRRVDRAEANLSMILTRPVMSSPVAVLDRQADDLSTLDGRGRMAIVNQLRLADSSLTSQLSTLRALSPQSVMERGYAVVRRADGTSVAEGEINEREILDIALSRGHIRARTVGAQEEE